MEQLLDTGSGEEILAALQASLQRSDESPFWAEKVMPLGRALLSVLLPLREQGLLFDPEGVTFERLEAGLFLRWCDLMCLKHLAFILQASNRGAALQRTKHTPQQAAAYEPIDLELLGSYLSSYGIDLHNEYADFPITHYNLHTGISCIIKNLLG
jgi:hypothetical protein